MSNNVILLDDTGLKEVMAYYKTSKVIRSAPELLCEELSYMHTAYKSGKFFSKAPAPNVRQRFGEQRTAIRLRQK